MTGFRDDFVWGAAAASFQIEGATQSGGRGDSVWDMFCREPGLIRDGSDGKTACDHYHRYREDIAIMQSLGLQAYRLSIAWPRVIPDGQGSINVLKKIGLQYERMFDYPGDDTEIMLFGTPSEE